MSDPTSQLRSATRRAKSDVANKLISMFLHELSRKISKDWPIKVDGQEYEDLVRKAFNNCCPYCLRDLQQATSIVEHLDGMNRYRLGLHVPGNVLIACRKCNSEKRRDDSTKLLSLAPTGWESFLSHDGSRCESPCPTCMYWKTIWEHEAERKRRLAENLERIRAFRATFREFQTIFPSVGAVLPSALTKLYSDCQIFAETEIKSLLQKTERLLAQ